MIYNEERQGQMQTKNEKKVKYMDRKTKRERQKEKN